MSKMLQLTVAWLIQRYQVCCLWKERERERVGESIERVIERKTDREMV